MVHSQFPDRYTITAALLLMAFVVRPLPGAFVLSLLCSSAFAWAQWKWHSTLIVEQPVWAK
jgi:hypothetical protein